MRWLFLSLFLCGFTPLFINHDSPKRIDDEFKQIENDLQPKEFRVFTTTPNLSDLRNGEVVIFSTGATKVMFRLNDEIYTINASCITVRR